MSDQGQTLIASFEALPESEKIEAAAEISRRTPQPEGDITYRALDELADELFVNLDLEESGRVAR